MNSSESSFSFRPIDQLSNLEIHFSGVAADIDEPLNDNTDRIEELRTIRSAAREEAESYRNQTEEATEKLRQLTRDL